MFFVILITCLLDIELILWGEILSWSLVGVKGLKVQGFSFSQCWPTKKKYFFPFLFQITFTVIIIDLFHVHILHSDCSRIQQTERSKKDYQWQLPFWLNFFQKLKIFFLWAINHWLLLLLYYFSLITFYCIYFLTVCSHLCYNYIEVINNYFFCKLYFNRSLVMEAVKTYGKMLIDRTTDEIFGNFASVWRELAHESQFRWVRSHHRDKSLW